MGRTGFVALLALILAAVSDAGTICFGADGHVAFEQFCDEHPLINNRTAIKVSGAHVVSLGAGDAPLARPHGPCFDLTLDPSSQWQARAEAPHVGAAPQAPAIVSPLIVPPPVDLSHHRVASWQPSSDPVLTPLRSTVLRI